MTARLPKPPPHLKRLAFALAVPCLVSISLAQTAPTLASPPARSAWVVKYKYDSPAQKKAPATFVNGMSAPMATLSQVKSREFTINDKIARSVTRYDDGKTVTAYILGGIGVRENPLETTDLIVDQLSSALMAQSDFRRSYPGLEWVLPSHYKGIVEYKGNPCHYFQKVPTPSPADKIAKQESEDINSIMSSDRAMSDPTLFSQGEGEAWIAADGRPVAAKVGAVTSTFTHAATEAVETITPPERFVAKAQAYFDSLNPRAK